MSCYLHFVVDLKVDSYKVLHHAKILNHKIKNTDTSALKKSRYHT